MNAAPITPFLWFSNDLEEVIGYYARIFKNLTVGQKMYSAESMPLETGALLTATLTINGQELTFMNGGSDNPFTHAVSLLVRCRDQAEVDYYWDALTAEGKPVACGWLVDKYGLSWQITPDVLMDRMCDPDPVKADKVARAMMQMVKIDIAAIEQAYNS